MPSVKNSSKAKDVKPISVRFRIDFGGICSIGFGKIALLEGIERTGSLSQAAREMGMSYRRAWSLVDAMNKSFDERVVESSTGGHRGGGAVLTAFGKELIATLRSLETKLLPPSEKHLAKIARRVKDRPAGRSLNTGASHRRNRKLSDD